MFEPLDWGQRHLEGLERIVKAGAPHSRPKIGIRGHPVDWIQVVPHRA